MHGCSGASPAIWHIPTHAPPAGRPFNTDTPLPGCLVKQGGGQQRFTQGLHISLIDGKEGGKCARLWTTLQECQGPLAGWIHRDSNAMQCKVSS